jgi:hypothetical protein
MARSPVKKLSAKFRALRGASGRPSPIIMMKRHHCHTVNASRSSNLNCLTRSHTHVNARSPIDAGNVPDSPLPCKVKWFRVGNEANMSGTVPTSELYSARSPLPVVGVQHTVTHHDSTSRWVPKKKKKGARRLGLGGFRRCVTVTRAPLFQVGARTYYKDVMAAKVVGIVPVTPEFPSTCR